MEKSIYVFLANKLVSCDAILPLLFELRKKRNVNKIYFYTTDIKTYNVIKKNFVLFEGINNIGELKFLGKSNSSLFESVIKLIKIFFFMIKTIFLLYFNNLNIIHFNLVNFFPWKILYYINKKRIFLFANTWGTKLEFDITNIGGRREKTRFSLSDPKAGTIVVFNKDSTYFIDKRVKSTNIELLDITVNFESWMEYIDKNYIYFIKKEFKDFFPKNVYTITLGTFISPVYLNSKDSVEKCLVDTLDVLTEFDSEAIILIKPHAISSEEIYKNIISNYIKNKIYITFLHPSVLTKISKVFICNYYSTTLAIAKKCGVPTIEYTEYSSKALEISNRGSMRPDLVDYFINKDKIELKNTLKNISTKNNNNIKYNSADSNILNLLS